MNGTVTLQIVSVRTKINIRLIKPYHREEAE